MAIHEVDWSKYLTTTSPLPPDVIFKVEDKTFPGHRFLLSGVSDVFQAQFYGGLRDEEAEVVVEGTTPEAFSIMMDYLYMRSPEFKCTASLYDCDISTLFAVLDLAEKYHLSTLIDKLEMEFSVFALNKENVMEVAHAAEVNRQFEVVSCRLLERCSQFLARNLKNFNDVQDFMRMAVNETHTNSLFDRLVLSMKL